MPVPDLAHHVNALVADLAADHGRVDLVGRRVACDPDERDAVVEAFDAFGVTGGAGVRVRHVGRVLLARYAGADGWVDPGDGCRPGESYRECARRGVSETAGVEPDIDGLAQVHLLYMDDHTDRAPAPNPFVVFDGRPASGNPDPTSREEVEEVAWFAEPPADDDLAYAELGELSPASE
jgi:ADP-ribose pyrophosphatase YjhB (NUDIX family)